MKILIILLITINLYAQHTLLISGVSFHKDSHNIYGDKYNEVNYGIGYRYSNFNSESVYYSKSILWIKDSYNNNMLSATIGVYKNIIKHVNLGIESGISSREILYGNEFRRKLIPIVFPSLELYYDMLSMNIVYIPELAFKEYRVKQAVYINFGYNF